jgi:hypothetical protein
MAQLCQLGQNRVSFLNTVPICSPPIFFGTDKLHGAHAEPANYDTDIAAR